MLGSRAAKGWVAPGFRITALVGLAAPQDNRIERLTKLQELRSSGVLTEAEFQAQKAKLLNS
jgi:hypothetical protein